MHNNAVVVIPCYNARKTIIHTIKGVFSYLPYAKIIIVDDNSPDKSAELIRNHFFHDRRIKLIIRKNKGGRGSAILKGFREGIKDKDMEFFVEMDADLCHNPKYIPILIKKSNIYDVAIASKYLKKSNIKGLSLKRKLFSRIANYFIMLILQIPITDYTNGFRCYKRKALEKINLDSFYSKGFIVLSEIAYKMHKNGASFCEIPLNFHFKNINKSNFNLTEIKEAFLTVLKLRFSKQFPVSAKGK